MQANCSAGTATEMCRSSESGTWSRTSQSRHARAHTNTHTHPRTHTGRGQRSIREGSTTTSWHRRSGRDTRTRLLRDRQHDHLRNASQRPHARLASDDSPRVVNRRHIATPVIVHLHVGESNMETRLTMARTRRSSPMEATESNRSGRETRRNTPTIKKTAMRSLGINEKGEEKDNAATAASIR